MTLLKLNTHSLRASKPESNHEVFVAHEHIIKIHALEGYSGEPFTSVVTANAEQFYWYGPVGEFVDLYNSCVSSVNRHTINELREAMKKLENEMWELRDDVFGEDGPADFL